MKYSLRFLSLFLGILFGYSAVHGQYSQDITLNRWLRKKPLISSIQIEGNRFFSDGKIKGVMFSRKDNIFRAIKSDRRRKVQRETIMRDTSEVKYLYLSSGFLGIQIKETFEAMPPDSNALIKMMIKEGRRFFYDKVELTGDFDLKFKGELNGIISQFKPYEPVDFFKLKQATFDCKSVLANGGYPYSSADYLIDSAGQGEEVIVKFIIRSDSLVHFGGLRILGASRFDTTLIVREMTFKRGDIYKRSSIIESQKRLLNTGNYLTLQLYGANKDSTVKFDRLHPDFILNLKEKRTEYLSIKTGAGQNPYKDLIWDFSAAWGKRNIFRSRRIEFSVSSSFVVFTEWRVISHSYRLRFTEPWFLGLRMPMTMTTQVEPGVRSAIQPYRIQTWSVALETNREIDDKVIISTGLEYRSINIYGLSYADQIKLRQDKGISLRRKIYCTINKDTRDHPFIPTAGSLSGIRFESTGGFLKGDESFILSEVSWSRYQRLWPGWISATRLKAGYVKEYGISREVPIDVRFYVGGANSIRGFAENALGPVSSDGTAQGAKVLLISNQEFRFPIIGRFWGSIFADMGNGFNNWSDVKVDNLAIAYGAGLQFISPAGPLRLDYARRVRTKHIEPGHHFHFTILYAF
ncbi:MAG: BamA/TamA family outer membrane protein [candidate division Zixibacteria bacterium]|nr:BamA/TamA family outer membrane protein [candidate division Zixibacteria bacterium]